MLLVHGYQESMLKVLVLLTMIVVLKKSDMSQEFLNYQKNQV